MPYQSVKQSNYIHMLAARGVPWAEKFVADSHGTHVLRKTAIKRVHGRRKHRK